MTPTPTPLATSQRTGVDPATALRIVRQAIDQVSKGATHG